MPALPDDFHPHDRQQAQLLADERGYAWYRAPERNNRTIHLIKPSTPLSEPGEFCFTAYSCQISAMEEVVRELNRAYLLGLRSQTA